MRPIKRIILLLLLMLLAQSSANAISNANIEYAKNYLIVLVHGIGDDYKCLEKVKSYLESSGLQGYVYSYEFSDPFLNIEKEGWEFGSRSYDNPEAIGKQSDQINDNDSSKRHSWQITKRENNGLSGTGKCWLEQTKEDFKIWKAKNYYNNDLSKVSDSEIPQKYIVICHSMGGLAVRSYIYGKDQNGNRFYNNDIEKYILIDTPNLGTGIANAVVWADDQTNLRYTAPVTMILATILIPTGVQKNLVLANAGYALAGSTAFDLIRGQMNRYSTPAMNDMLPDSDFLKNLNNASLGSTYENMKKRIIVATGVPTIKNTRSLELFSLNYFFILRLMASGLNSVFESDLNSWEEKMMSIHLTTMTGIPFLEDGDLVVTADSQKGEGVSSLSDATVQEYRFTNQVLSQMETVIDVTLVASYFVPSPANWLLATFSAASYGAMYIGDESIRDFIRAHVSFKEKYIFTSNNYDGTVSNMLDRALFDQPVNGSATATAVRQYSLTLSSNITREAGTIKTLSSFHVVSPEAMTESSANTSIFSTPIIVDGKEKRMETFTVKEPPTRIEGVLRDFMPLKMQYFQYSENFAAWKNITVLNEWGHFQIDNLKLAEGQNVIAFRAKNKVGYESNQHLKIILNTIPMLIQNMLPAPSTYVRNNLPEISGEFSKSVYVTNTTPGQGIPDITSAWLYKNEAPFIDLLKDPNFKVEYVKVNDYKTAVKFSWKAVSPLEDGKYQVRVSAKSEVGSSQGAWMFWVDTTPPTITFTLN